MPFAEEILIAANTSAQDGVGHGAALGADGAGGQGDDERHAAVNDPVHQIADGVRRGLDHPGHARGPEAIEQITDRDAEREQHPHAIDPAIEGCLEVGLQDGPVRQKAIDPHARWCCGSGCIHDGTSLFTCL